MDLRHRYLCTKHGKASLIYADTALMRKWPRLAILFAEQPEYKFIRRWLHPRILHICDRFPHAPDRRVIRDVMPYYNAKPSHCVPPQTKALSDTLACEFTACGGGDNTRLQRWGNFRVCVACHWRLRRQHVRAARQFDTVFKLVRKRDTAFIYGLLHPTLQERLRRHSVSRASQAVSSDRQSEWV